MNSQLDVASLDDYDLTHPVNTRDSIVPVTIKQIHEALDNAAETGQLLIDNQPRRHVSIVGLVCRCVFDEISRTYTLDDGTGIITVQDFTQDFANSETPLGFRTYAYVVGRVMISEREISAFCVRQVEDFNQIPFHVMQTLYVHLHSIHGLPQRSVYSAIEQAHRQQAGGEEAQVVEVGSEIDQAILGLLRRGNVRVGTHHRVIVAELGGRFSVEDIDRGLERLKENCDIYNGEPDCWVPIG
jgi:replication factor A2